MLRFQGQTSNYVELDSTTGQYQYLPITCTSCHDPDRFLGEQLHIRRSYGDQEKAVEQVTIFRTLIGGRRDGKWHGSHAHNGMKIRYLADPTRATITEVEVTRADGSTDKFVAKDAKAPAGAAWMEMGCTDCHNRPAHQFHDPETLVDRALSHGSIDTISSRPTAKTSVVCVAYMTDGPAIILTAFRSLVARDIRSPVRRWW